MPQPRDKITPEQLLADYPPEIQSLANRLRQLVKEVLPEAEERTYPGWRAVGYRHPQAGYIGGIFLNSNMVRLGFEFGAMLPDPQGRLKPGPSSSKQVRYLEIREAAGLRPEVIREYLLAAVELRDGDRLH